MPEPITTIAYLTTEKAKYNPLLERLSIDGQLYTIHDPLIDQLAGHIDSQFSYLKGEIDNKQDTLTIDASPTENSNNFVTSGTVYSQLATKANDGDLHSVAKSGDYYDLENIPTSYITKDVDDLTNYYTKSEISTQLGEIKQFKYQIVSDDLPTASAETMFTIYLKQASGGTASGDYYIEWITLDKGESADPRYAWEMIGTTDISISGVVTDGALANILTSYTTNEDLATILTSYTTNEDLATILTSYATISYVTTELDKKQDNLEWDSTVTENSNKQITSGTAYTAIWGAENRVNQKIESLNGNAVKTVDNIAPTNGNIPLEHTSLLHIAYVRAETITNSTNYQLAIGTTNTSVVTGVQTTTS